MSIFSITFSGFSMTFSPNLVFIKKYSSGGSSGADGVSGILGAGPKKFCLGVVCCDWKEGWKKLSFLGDDGSGDGGSLDGSLIIIIIIIIIQIKRYWFLL